MVERLTKGRALIAVLVSSFVALGVALFGSHGLLTSVMLSTAAALFGLFLIIFVTWAKKSVGIQKQNFQKLSQAIKSVEDRQNAFFENTARQSTMTESLLSDIEQLLRQKTVPSAFAQSKKADTQKRRAVSDRGSTASLYAHGSLPSSKIIKSNSSGLVGRRAASIETESTSESNLDVILNSGRSRWEKNVATIVHSDLDITLNGKYNVVPLRPNQVAGVLEEPLDYILIDERCSRMGQWANFLETFRLSTYQELANGLKNARMHGAIVVLVEDPISSALTNSIREFADIRLNLNSGQRSKQLSSLEFCRVVQDLVFQKGQTHA